MKKIKDIRVTVKYRVGIGGLEVPDEVHQQLQKIEKEGIEVGPDDMEYTDAVEWLTSHIKEKDCMDWQCEIDELI